VTGYLTNRWLSIVIRLALGIVFIFSAYPKIVDPPGFAHAIWNYRILPSFAINSLALILPWLELLAGAALVSGVLRRGAAAIAAVMLAIFIAALALNLIRGNPVDCGCFSLSAVGKSREQLLNGMRIDIARDLGLLLMSFQALTTPVTWRIRRREA
jgi:uncharacterized membrane protein YphA (DoxX/SURF4 family)